MMLFTVKTICILDNHFSASKISCRSYDARVGMELDWSRCIICQMETTEPLKCPANCPVADTHCVEETYRKFLESVSEFREIHSMPCSVPFGIEHLTPLCVNGASWHKSYYQNVGET